MIQCRGGRVVLAVCVSRIHDFLCLGDQIGFLLFEQRNAFRAIRDNFVVEKIREDDGKGQPQDASKENRIKNWLRGKTVQIK